MSKPPDRSSGVTAGRQSSERHAETLLLAASHDLREPQRAVTGFSEVLLADYSDALPAEARDLVQRIQVAGLRMEAMLDGISDMARLTEVSLLDATVDLSQLVHDCATTHCRDDTACHVEWIVPSSVVTRGDPDLLRKVVNVLISNAFLATRQAAHAIIEFGAEPLSASGSASSEAMSGPDTQATVFFVRDNGIGFDMRLERQLFQPFGRLHRAEVFPGVGMGLAIAARIIALHGGDIWARSQPAGGATIYFSLPTGNA